MKVVIAPRASTILYNTLKSNQEWFEGGFIILPANVCPIVPITILKAVVKFKFVDIDFQSQCLNISKLRKELLNPLCKGVLFVHSYGNTQETHSLFKDIKAIRNDVFLIDDCCIDIPQIHQSQQNPFANLSLFSTGYAKFVEFGYGGFGYISEDVKYVATSGPYKEQDHTKLVAQMNDCIQQGKSFVYTDSDWLERKDNLELGEYFEKIESQIPKSQEHKNKLNAIYTELLPANIQMSTSLNKWRFNLQVDNKIHLIKLIFDAGLFASSHYASISTIFGGSQSPVAEKTHSKMLNLFNDYRFTEAQAIQVCEIINKELNK